MMLVSITSLIISIIIFITVPIYYSIILRLRMRSRMTGYATDTNGRNFKAITNNSEGLYFSGVASGGLINQLAGSDSKIGESLIGTVGVAQFYVMNHSTKYMSHPEIVTKMIEEAPNVTRTEVYEILRINKNKT